MKIDTKKLLNTGIKIAAVCLTTPATWLVAGSLYTGWPVLQAIIQPAAVVLVEGALMLGWYQLDNDRKAEMSQRVLYAVLAGVAYVSLWSIAISHGEGAAGITFRLTLGVLLGYSVFESGILANIKTRRAKERSVYNAPQIKRYKWKAEIGVAKKEIDSWKAAREEDLKVTTEVDTKRRSKERKERLQSIDGKHSGQPTAKRAGFPYPVDKINASRKADKASRLELIGTLKKDNPELSASDVVETIREQTGVAESTAWGDWSEYQSASNGNGHKVTA
jgi:hypothetical protein